MVTGRQETHCITHNKEGEEGVRKEERSLGVLTVNTSGVL